ncbi:hypothetical protein WN943_015984 [Citrus x changshan-huyou]
MLTNNVLRLGRRSGIMSHASVIASTFVGASMPYPQDSPESKHISLERITKTSSSAA